MSTHDTSDSIKHILIDEVIEEIGSLDEADLDAFLLQLGEDPDTVLETSRLIRDRAIAEKKRSRLRAAQREIKSREKPNAAALKALSIERKREIFDRIKLHSEASGEMTLAARNGAIETEQDLDSFLEACLLLGRISEDGDLSDSQ